MSRAAFARAWAPDRPGRIIEQGLRSPSRPVDPAVAAVAEPRFGHDFGDVRVHVGEQAASSAAAIRARAFTAGEHIVLGPGASPSDTRLMAHELAHVVQQRQGGSPAGAEFRAQSVAAGLAPAQSVGGAPPGIYRQEAETRQPQPPGSLPPLRVDWASLAGPNLMQFTPSRLQPWALSTAVRSRPPWLPQLGYTPGLTGQGSSGTSGGPEAPSRLPLVSSGQFSLGLRLGFPESEAQQLPGMPESALQAALRRAEFQHQMFTGQIPSGWDAVDKGQLVRYIWSIFSTHIAPGFARNLAGRLSTPAGPGGTSYQLDLILLTNFSSEVGGGLSFTLQW